MNAVLLQVRADLRARWRSWLGLTLLVAVVGGAVIALWAGGRRTETAYPRFLSSQRAADMMLYGGAVQDPTTRARIEALPEVVASATALALPAIEPDLVPVVATDGRYGRDVNRFKFLAGRPLDADRADETVVGFLLARQRDLRVGSRLTIPVVPGVSSAVTLRVMGIVAEPSQFSRQADTSSLAMYLSPAFLATPLGRQAAAASGDPNFVALRLRHGAADAPAIQAAVQGATNRPVSSSTLADQAANVQRSMHVEAVALWLMAGLTLAAGALVLMQLLTRQVFEGATEDSTLSALGMTSGQLAAAGVARVTAIATTGAVVAALAAWAVSPLLPLGTARIAEPHPGLAFDGAAIGAGAFGLVVLVVLLGTATQLGGSRRRGQSTRLTGEAEAPSSSLTKVLRWARLPLTLDIGARLALQSGRGRTAVPARTTLAAAAVAIGALAASMTFGASLAHLLDTPELYGVTFDAHVQGNGEFADVSLALPALRADPAVGAFAVGTAGIPMQAGKVTFGAQYTSSVQGSLEPTVIEGRLPAGPDEILLGSKTMRQLHSSLGQTIRLGVTGMTGPVPMRVVGRGTLPPVDDLEQLGRGAVLSPSAVARLATMAPAGFPVPPALDVFVRFNPGPDSRQAISNLAARLGGDFTVRAPGQPSGVADFGRVRNLPQILAGVLGVVALFAILHLLLSAIRRRRRDLAVLKSLGMPPSKLSATIFWQATTIGLVSTAIGLPLGIVAGRWAWNVVASQLGVAPQPEIPGLVLGALCAGVLIVVNLVAAGPAVVARRVAPASVFRTE